MARNELVVNNTVKMEWLKRGWLQTSARGGKAVFICASKEYETANGPVTVYFTATTSFLIESDEGLWSADEFYPVIKKNLPGDFPYNLEEYVVIIPSGERECDVDALEKYGLTEYKDDIEARQGDIAPYGYEKTFNPLA